MAKKDAPELGPLQAYVANTERLLTTFSAQAASYTPPQAKLVRTLARAIKKSLGLLGKAIENALATAGIAADEVQDILDSFGATELLDDLNEQLAAATTPADLAAIGTVLPIVKKIIRFTVDILKLQLSIDLDKVLEFIDELATTTVDLVSPKGAEAMHRAEVRFLEAQYHLDRLGTLKELPAEGNGR